jgi:hypothetical protein
MGARSRLPYRNNKAVPYKYSSRSHPRQPHDAAARVSPHPKPRFKGEKKLRLECSYCAPLGSVRVAGNMVWDSDVGVEASEAQFNWWDEPTALRDS